MQREKQDLTRGPLGKQILLFSIPLIFSNLLQVLFNMADVAVLGKFAGTAALGAVGSTTTLVTMFTDFLIGLSGGINVLAARHFGAKDRKNMVETVHTSLILSIIVVFYFCLADGYFQKEFFCCFRQKPNCCQGRFCTFVFICWECRLWLFITLAMRYSARWARQSGLYIIFLWPGHPILC